MNLFIFMNLNWCSALGAYGLWVGMNENEMGFQLKKLLKSPEAVKKLY